MRSDWRRPRTFKGLEEGERRIKLTVSYDGSRYHGWQSQDGAVSVQSTIESCLSFLGEDTRILGSGRTDSGVHALGQVCHFDTRSSIPAGKFAIILNTRLPKDIRIMRSEEADGSFHARFTTMSREYWYLIKERADMLPFDDRRYMPVSSFPDAGVLNGYAKAIFGTHDFTAFASSRDESPSKFRDIYLSEWDWMEDAYSYPVLRYRVAGNAFMYHQVRSMVGTMLSLARDGKSADEMKSILDSRDRSRALSTAIPDGLYLARISYDEAEYQWFEDEYGR